MRRKLNIFGHTVSVGIWPRSDDTINDGPSSRLGDTLRWWFVSGIIIATAYTSIAVLLETAHNQRHRYKTDKSTSARIVTGLIGERQPDQPPHNPQSWPDWFWSIGLTTILGGAATFVALRTLDSIRRQIVLQNRGLRVTVAASRAAFENATAAKENAIAAANSATIASDTLETTKIIERAYVALSHTQPGLTFHYAPEDATEPTFGIQCAVAAVNSGNTPAAVIASEIKLATAPRGAELPSNPDRPSLPQRLDPIFMLMPRDRNHFWRNFPLPSRTDLQRIQFQGVQVFVVGWILYRDKFGQLHRTGYARKYIHSGDPKANNLVFVEQPGYNYEEDLDS